MKTTLKYLLILLILVLGYFIIPQDNDDELSLSTDISVQDVDARIQYMFGPKRVPHITILFEQDSAVVVQAFFPKTLSGAEICRNCFWDGKFNWEDTWVQNQHIKKTYYSYDEFKKKYPQIVKERYNEN